MPPTTQAQTKGASHSVPCPWCGGRNDLRQLLEHNMADAQNEAQIDCDHCGNIFQVASISTVTVVHVMQSPRNDEILSKRRRGGGAVARRPQQQPQKKPGLLARLTRR